MSKTIKKFLAIICSLLIIFWGFSWCLKMRKFMGHFMGQKSQMGKKFVPKFIRENNTARKFCKKRPKKWSYGPKNWPTKYFWPMLKPLRHKGFGVFWAKNLFFNLIYLRN